MKKIGKYKIKKALRLDPKAFPEKKQIKVLIPKLLLQERF